MASLENQSIECHYTTLHYTAVGKVLNTPGNTVVS